MKILKWEYTVRTLNTFYSDKEFTDKLNKAGEEGWEMVSIYYMNSKCKITFKRPCGYVDNSVI